MLLKLLERDAFVSTNQLVLSRVLIVYWTLVLRPTHHHHLFYCILNWNTNKSNDEPELIEIWKKYVHRHEKLLKLKKNLVPWFQFFKHHFVHFFINLQHVRSLKCVLLFEKFRILQVIFLHFTTQASCRKKSFQTNSELLIPFNIAYRVWFEKLNQFIW